MMKDVTVDRLTNDEYCELFEILGKIREHRPDVRIGQLICNLGMMMPDLSGRSAWDVADRELLVGARRHLIQLENRTQTEEIGEKERLELLSGI